MSKKVLILLAEGFEEMEAVITADICTRAGLEVVIAGLDSIDVVGAHDISMIADCELSDIDEDFDAVVIPGGMPGAENIADCNEAMELIQSYADEGKFICAICAAPGVVLGKTDILSGHKATCYPGFQDRFKSDVKYEDKPVVQDGNIITGKGPGAAAYFAETIVDALIGKGIGDKVLKQAFF